MPATVVSLSSFPECVAITYEHSRHTQLHRDCPVGRLTCPLSARTFPLPTAVRPHRLPPTSGLQHLWPTFNSVLRPSTSAHEEIHFHQSPHSAITMFYCEQLLATMSLPDKVVQ